MKAMPEKSKPSLENLVETLDLGQETLHPGGVRAEYAILTADRG
jgi:hypothetical protein